MANCEWVFAMTGMIANELFVDFSQRIVQVRGSDSYTRPISLDLRRAAYVSADQALEKEMQSISSALSGAWPKILLALLNTPEGPPYRTAKVFLTSLPCSGEGKWCLTPVPVS